MLSYKKFECIYNKKLIKIAYLKLISTMGKNYSDIERGYISKNKHDNKKCQISEFNDEFLKVMTSLSLKKIIKKRRKKKKYNSRRKINNKNYQEK